MKGELIVAVIIGFTDCFHYQPRISSTIYDLQMAITPIRPGSIAALITPMLNTHEVDYLKFKSLLKWHVEENTDGVVILGTTGESSTICLEERTNIIKTAVETVAGAFPVIVGTGTIETKKVIESSKHAQSLGADGVLVITPYYVKPPQRALIQHFKAIADSIEIPVLMYNCLGRTGVNMAVETVEECSRHPNIVGLKDSVGTILDRVVPMRQLCDPSFLLFR